MSAVASQDLRDELAVEREGSGAKADLRKCRLHVILTVLRNRFHSPRIGGKP